MEGGSVMAVEKSVMAVEKSSEWTEGGSVTAVEQSTVRGRRVVL